MKGCRQRGPKISHINFCAALHCENYVPKSSLFPPKSKLLQISVGSRMDRKSYEQQQRKTKRYSNTFLSIASEKHASASLWCEIALSLPVQKLQARHVQLTSKMKGLIGHVDGPTWHKLSLSPSQYRVGVGRTGTSRLKPCKDVGPVIFHSDYHKQSCVPTSERNPFVHE